MKTNIIYLFLSLLLVSCGNSVERRHYDSGTLKSYGMISDGKEHGKWVYLEESGDTNRVVNYKNGIKEGKSYTYTDNVISGVETYQNGFRNGTKKVYYPSGQIMSEGVMKNDRQDGIWKSYYENGNVETEFRMSNGKQTGTFINYYSNGQVEVVGEDINGNGLFEYYDSLGNLLWKIEYEGGVPVDTLVLETPL